MSTLDDREKAQENKYAHDEELRFKTHARATKLFGVWVAEKIGLPPELYAQELVNLVSAGKREGDIVQKVVDDAEKKGVSLDLDLMEEKLIRCLAEAKEQVLKA